MKLAIMQPYFLPYIGYFQLIGAADVFLVYDNIKYTKKGWINRNRFLQNNSDAIFSLPLKKDSDYLDVVQRELSTEFNRDKFLNQLNGAYRSAPHFKEVYPLIERIVRYEDPNLFRFIYHSIISVCQYINIHTKFQISSDIAINHELKNQEKVIALCQQLGADTYMNAIGGIDLYERNAFDVCDINLNFIKSKPLEYTQFGKNFVPWLSIVDVLMFNSRDEVREVVLNNFELI